MVRNSATIDSVNSWWEYVERISDGAKLREIAEKVGVTGPSVGRWKDSRPDPEKAAAFARAYDRPVLEAFIAAGYLTPEEAGQPATPMADVTEVSDKELVAEVARRIEYGGGGRGDDQKIDSGADGSTGGAESAPQRPPRTEDTLGRGSRLARDRHTSRKD